MILNFVNGIFWVILFFTIFNTLATLIRPLRKGTFIQDIKDGYQEKGYDRYSRKLIRYTSDFDGFVKILKIMIVISIIYIPHHHCLH